MTTPDDITLPELPSAWIWKYANGEEEVVFVDASRMNFDPREEDVPTTVTSLYTADQLRTAVLEDRKRMYSRFRMVFAHKELSHESGNAPNHSHAVPGIWDSDNGKLAGKPCAWCSLWNEAVAALAAQEGKTESTQDSSNG